MWGRHEWCEQREPNALAAHSENLTHRVSLCVCWQRSEQKRRPQRGHVYEPK